MRQPRVTEKQTAPLYEKKRYICNIYNLHLAYERVQQTSGEECPAGELRRELVVDIRAVQAGFGVQVAHVGVPYDLHHHVRLVCR